LGNLLCVKGDPFQSGFGNRLFITTGGLVVVIIDKGKIVSGGLTFIIPLTIPFATAPATRANKAIRVRLSTKGNAVNAFIHGQG